MPSARRIAAILLLALWLPALLHCRLEAAGVMFGTDCCQDAPQPVPVSDESCADDSCDVAEGAFAQPSSASLAAPAPVLFACLLAAEILPSSIALAPPPVMGVVEAEAAPPEIMRTWMFVVRAAPPPRAPSLV